MYQMNKFFNLSPQHRVLLALAALDNFHEPREIAHCVNDMVDYFGRDRSEEFRKNQRREATTVGNMLREMSKTKYPGQKGFLIEMSKRGRKLVYKSSEYTVVTRADALMVLLIRKTSQARNGYLTLEQAIRVTENEDEPVFNSGGNQLNKEEVIWLMSEIAKEGLARDVLRSQIELVIKAGYFRYDKSRDLLRPTDRLNSIESSYIQALVDLLPDFTHREQLHNEAPDLTDREQLHDEAPDLTHRQQLHDKAVERTVSTEIRDKGEDLGFYTFSSIQSFRGFVATGALSGNQKSIEARFIPKTAKDLMNFIDLLLSDVAPGFYKGSFELNILFTNFQDLSNIEGFTQISTAFFNNGSIFSVSYVPATASSLVAKSEPGSHFGFEDDGMIFVREAFNR
jgi:hypothetical protein